MKLFYIVLLLFSSSCLNSAHQAATIGFESFNPFTMHPIGLNNLGNSCYMNAMLQCLYLISPITKFLVDTHGLNTQDQLLLAYQKFVNSYTYALEFDKPLRPINFHSVLTKTYNWGSDQQDSQEALNNLLNVFSPGLLNNYQLRLISNIKCNAGHETQPNELANMLTIPITATPDLIDYLNHFFIEEQMTGDNIFHCDSCRQLVEAHKQIKLGNLPDYLIIKINLEKYSIHVDAAGDLIYTGTKQFAHPQIPLDNLNMANYLNDDIDNTNSDYELFGCIWHLEFSLKFGHYVSTVKIGDKWYLCDDTNISEILQPEDTLRHGYLSSKKRDDANPYVLFYRKIRLPQEDAIDYAK